jgi:hypothetical protein
VTDILENGGGIAIYEPGGVGGGDGICEIGEKAGGEGILETGITGVEAGSLTAIPKSVSFHVFVLGEYNTIH